MKRLPFLQEIVFESVWALDRSFLYKTLLSTAWGVLLNYKFPHVEMQLVLANFISEISQSVVQ